MHFRDSNATTTQYFYLAQNNSTLLVLVLSLLMVATLVLMYGLQIIYEQRKVFKKTSKNSHVNS